jgi:hypothetical protein
MLAIGQVVCEQTRAGLRVGDVGLLLHPGRENVACPPNTSRCREGRRLQNVKDSVAEV